jgi:porin
MLVNRIVTNDHFHLPSNADFERLISAENLAAMAAVFTSNLSMQLQNEGSVGIAGGTYLNDHLYVIDNLNDANGDYKRAGFDTFFQDREYFYSLEFGWVSSFERRYLDKINILAWYQDEREDAGVEASKGVMFTFSKFIKDKWLVFLRPGILNREVPLYNATISTGVGYYVASRDDVIGFGLNWSKLAPDGLDDQYTAELFHRLQLAQNLQITPDIQLLINPAPNPDEDHLWVFALRARLTF